MLQYHTCGWRHVRIAANTQLYNFIQFILYSFHPVKVLLKPCNTWTPEAQKAENCMPPKPPLSTHRWSPSIIFSTHSPHLTTPLCNLVVMPCHNTGFGYCKKQHTYSWQFMGTIIPIMTLHQKWPTKGLWNFGDLSHAFEGRLPPRRASYRHSVQQWLPPTGCTARADRPCHRHVIAWQRQSLRPSLASPQLICLFFGFCFVRQRGKQAKIKKI